MLTMGGLKLYFPHKVQLRGWIYAELELVQAAVLRDLKQRYAACYGFFVAGFGSSSQCSDDIEVGVGSGLGAAGGELACA